MFSKTSQQQKNDVSDLNQTLDSVIIEKDDWQKKPYC